MQVKDAEVNSPNQTEKGKTKNIEEAVSNRIQSLNLACMLSIEKSKRSYQKVGIREERT
jgi:hypothetical protein